VQNTVPYQTAPLDLQTPRRYTNILLLKIGLRVGWSDATVICGLLYDVGQHRVLREVSAEDLSRYMNKIESV